MIYLLNTIALTWRFCLLLLASVDFCVVSFDSMVSFDTEIESRRTEIGQQHKFKCSKPPNESYSPYNSTTAIQLNRILTGFIVFETRLKSVAPSTLNWNYYFREQYGLSEHYCQWRNMGMNESDRWKNGKSSKITRK